MKHCSCHGYSYSDAVFDLVSFRFLWFGELPGWWVHSNSENERRAAVQMLADFAERLQIMHSRGYVHSKLNRCNILWLENSERWALLDGGCVAREGVRPVLPMTACCILVTS
jgi:hypothetical protein